MIDFATLTQREVPLAVVGLGYVGLPLAVSLARHFAVIGFDIDPKRIEQLQAGHDETKEVDQQTLARTSIEFSCDPAALGKAGLIIIAVPTPIDAQCQPDLSPVRRASAMVGETLRADSVVVYESTVYPGLTEEVCVPVLQQYSGLRCGEDFFVGYSPERINPGDRVHTLENIVKVVAGQTPACTELLYQLYSTVVPAGVHKASSIKVAEAAKVIENTQRDLNIALMNELALIFDRMDIDTQEVLEAAETKWNFLPFRPGLVGGHCIGVDPYYLTFRAQALGLQPQVILAGRQINDSMGKYIAEVTIKKLITLGRLIKGARIAVLGLTFKENVPDLRNTKVTDIIAELEEYGTEVLVHDPVADPARAQEEYGLTLTAPTDLTALDALVVAVAHAHYTELLPTLLPHCFADPTSGLLIDVKGIADPESLSKDNITYWKL